MPPKFQTEAAVDLDATLGQDDPSVSPFDVPRPTDARPNPLANPQGQGLLASAIWGVRLLTLAFTLVVWAIIGFVFWLPLLARNTLVFTTHTLHANLRRGNATVNSLGLEHAITFYINGFQNIIDGIVKPSTTERDYAGPPFRFWRLAGESLITGAFWWAALMLLSYLGVGGEDLGNALKLPFVRGYELVSGWMQEATAAQG